MRKVVPGQKNKLRASTVNSMLDAAQDYRDRNQALLSSDNSRKDAAHGIVLVRNDTGYELPIFSVVELGPILFTPDPGADHREYTYSGIMPTGTNAFGVNQEPIAQGAFGKVMISGVTPVNIQRPVNDTSKIAGVTAGQIYLVTGNVGVTLISEGTYQNSTDIHRALINLSTKGGLPGSNISVTIDGGGTVISSSNPSMGGATVVIPAACTIMGWVVEGDTSGSIVVDVKRANAAVPSASIVGAGNKPTLSGAQYAAAAPTGWTSNALAANDVIGFSVSSATTVQRVTVTLLLSGSTVGLPGPAGPTGPSGGVTSVTGTAPIASSGGATPAISVNAFTGDSGSGGAKGAVPAPASGDTAAKKYLFADGTWRTITASDLAFLAAIASSGSATDISAGTLAAARLPSFTNHALLVGTGATGAPTQLAVPASGTMLQGVAGADPLWTATPSLGVAGVTPGSLAFFNNTSGFIGIGPVAGVALGAKSILFPNVNGNVVTTGDAGTVTNAMLSGPVSIANGGTNSATGLNNAKTMISSGGAIVESTGYQAKTAQYTVGIGDHNSVIDVDATGIALQPYISLPTVASTNKGLVVTIRKADSGAIPVGIYTPNGTDGINGSFPNIDSSTGALNIVSFTGGGTTSIVLTMSTDPTLKYIVGGVIVVSTGTSIDGAYVITAMSSASKTISYTRTSSSAAATTTGTTVGVQTWLNTQGAAITLVSTGTAGNGAKQGWEVISAKDSLVGTYSGALTQNAWSNSANEAFAIPPGEWDLSGIADFHLSGAIANGACGIAITTANNIGGAQGVNECDIAPPTASNDNTAVIPPDRVGPVFPTRYFMNFFPSTSAGAITCGGSKFTCRRVG